MIIRSYTKKIVLKIMGKYHLLTKQFEKITKAMNLIL